MNKIEDIESEISNIDNQIIIEKSIVNNSLVKIINLLTNQKNLYIKLSELLESNKLN